MVVAFGQVPLWYVQNEAKPLTDHPSYDNIRTSLYLYCKVIQMLFSPVVNIVVVVASVLLIGYKEAIAAGRAM